VTATIERVARAMFKRGHEGDETWEEVEQEIKTTYLLDAYVAIEAMREPTEGMKISGELAECWEGDATSIYRAMIDAALKEKAQ
jgi:hypothetical protein